MFNKILDDIPHDYFLDKNVELGMKNEFKRPILTPEHEMS